MKRRLVIAAVLLVGVVMAMSVHVLANEEVTIQLKWVHQAQFAGFYVAEERGYYIEEGLDVSLLEGGPGIDKIDRLLAGEADFCVDSVENLLLRREAGDSVVAISVSFQRNPVVFIAKTASGIVEPADFLGMTAAILGADYQEVQFYAMFDRLGLDTSQVEYVPYEFDNASFLADQADITLAYVSGGLIRIRNEGYEVITIWPGDYGVLLYADVLVTTRAMIQEQPDLVEGVLRATIKGWGDVVLEPDNAVDVVMAYAVDSTRDIQTEMMYATVPLLTLGTSPIGWMEAEIWESMINALTQYGVITMLINPQAAFDTRFLEAIYDEE